MGYTFSTYANNWIRQAFTRTTALSLHPRKSSTPSLPLRATGKAEMELRDLMAKVHPAPDIVPPTLSVAT